MTTNEHGENGKPVFFANLHATKSKSRVELLACDAVLRGSPRKLRCRTTPATTSQDVSCRGCGPGLLFGVPIVKFDGPRAPPVGIAGPSEVVQVGFGRVRRDAPRGNFLTLVATT